MIKRIHLPITLLMILGLILGACAAPTAAPTAIPPTQAEVVQPTAIPEPTATPAPDVAALFQGLIDSLPPDKGYGTVKPAALNEALAGTPPFVLDVREAAELEKDGYIEGAVHIPIRDLLKNLDRLPGLDDPIVVYCASGHRGGLAMASLKLLGYTDVRNLAGGLGAWKKASLPVVTGSPLPAAETIGSPIVADQALYNLLDGFLAGLPEGFYSVKSDKLNEALASGMPPTVIDIRTTGEYAKDGYIEGSLNVPMGEILGRLGDLPAPDQPIVVHCVSGHRGSIVTMALHLLGYSDVVNLAGGLNAWKAAQMPIAGWVDWPGVWAEFLAVLPEHEFYTVKADALNAALADQPPFVVDVRETSEIEADGHIAGAINIPVRSLLQNLDKLPGLDAPIVVYCASGHRGGLATAALHLLGYTDVRNLAGGLGAWKKASLPLEPGLPAAPAAGAAPVVDATRLRDLDAFLASLPDGFYSVKAPDLNAELAGTTPPTVVDIRTPQEVAEGTIAGAVNIQMDQLLSNLGQLPDKSAPTVVMCKTGHRGAIALMALHMLGYTQVRNLAGGISAWIAAELPTSN